MFCKFKQFFYKNNQDKFLNIIVDILIIDIADAYLTKMKDDKGENIPEEVLSFLDKTVVMSEKRTKINKLKKSIKPLKEEQKKYMKYYLNMNIDVTGLIDQNQEENKEVKDEQMLNEHEKPVNLNFKELVNKLINPINLSIYQQLVIKFNIVLSLMINNDLQKKLIDFLQEKYSILEQTEDWNNVNKNEIFDFLIKEIPTDSVLCDIDI